MRKIERIAKAMAGIALIAMITAACTDSLETNKREVRFSAGSGIGTKSSYSGAQADGRERVDWTIGDEITIYCFESPYPISHIFDYKVSEITSTTGYYSVGKITRRAGEVGLNWADDEDLVHHFYAITPSNHSNSSISMRYYEDTNIMEYHGAIPASQPPVNVSADNNGNYVADPDMLNLIMIAQKAQAKGTSETVQLDFSPVVTAAEFTVMNGYADQDAMTLSAIKLSSSQRLMSGKFAGIYGEPYGAYDNNAGKEVTIPFNTPVSVAYGKTLKFTVFMLGLDPKPIDNLTIEFVTDADTSIKAELKTTNGGIEFPRDKKSYVTGLIVPGASVWTISAVPDAITAWDSDEKTVEVLLDDSNS